MSQITAYEQGFLDGVRDANGWTDAEFEDNTIDAILGSLTQTEGAWDEGHIKGAQSDFNLTLNAAGKMTL
jgi:hypothetical protein